MTTQEFLLQEKELRDKTIRVISQRASTYVKNPSSIKYFEDGIRLGWHECIATMKLHGLLK